MDELLLSGQLTIEATEAPAAGAVPKLRRFRAEVYRGGILNLPNFRYPLVLELSGLDVGNEIKPALLDHKKDADHVIGQTDRVTVENNVLIAEGHVMGSSAEVLRAVDLNDKGFAWQASVGATPTAPPKLVPAGQTVTVNGQSFIGPVYVAQRSLLGEISFCVLGVDRTSSARIAASAAGESTMSFEEYCAGMGFDPATLSDAQRQSLQNMHMQASQPTKPETPEVPPPETKPEPAVTASAPVLEITASEQAELHRISAVHAVCHGAHGEFPQIEASAVEQGWDVRRTRLEVIRAARPAAPAVIVRPNVRSAEVIEASLAFASGIDSNAAHERGWYSPQVIEAAESAQWRNMSLVRLGHEIVAAAGGHLIPGKLDTNRLQQIFAADLRLNDPGRQPIEAAGSFTTLSMSGVLGNLANKLLLTSFLEVKRIVPLISTKQSPSDYKEFKAFQMTMTGDLEEIGSDGQLPDVSLREEEFANQVQLRGAYLSVSEKTFVNDDLGVFAQVPKMFGRKAAISHEKAGMTVFLATTGSFYSTTNGNYMEGASTALSVDSLTAASKLADEQTDADGDPIMLNFNRILVPPALTVLAGDLYKEKNIVLAGTTDTKRPANNSHVGSFAPLSSPYLGTKPGLTNSSDTAWYLLPEQGDMSCLQAAYLNGQETPTVEKGEVDFRSLGIAWRVTYRFGFAKGQKRAVVKSKGAA